MPQSFKFDYPVILMVPPVIKGERAALRNLARGPVPSLPPLARQHVPARQRPRGLGAMLPAAMLGAAAPMAELAGGEQPINSTLGWDTVFAVPVSKVNDHFAASKLYPTDFSGSFSGGLYSVTITGNFGAWRIALGGSGAIVKLSIPIASGTMAVKGGNSFDLKNGTIFVEVKLNYLPQPSEGAKGTPNNLLVANKPMDQTGHVAQVIQVTIPNQTDPTVLAAATGCFQDFFDKNLARVSFVFNTVNLNAVADKEAFQWLKPTTSSYAYYEPGNATSLNQAVFGVLCMVNNNSPGNNTNQLAPSAIPTQSGVTSDSGFSINNQLFLRQMVLPVMSASFNANNPSGKIDQSYFKIQNGDTEIVNTKDIPLATVVYGRINYYPQCTKFKLTIMATELQIYTMVHVNISPGIDTYVEQTVSFKPTLKTDAQGNQYLDFVQSHSEPPNHWTNVAKSIVITSIVIGIIGFVLAGIAAIVLSGAAAVCAAIVIGVVFGLAAAVPQLIKAVQAEGVVGKVPSIAGLITAATHDVKWTGGQDFKIAFTQINGTFQMGGIAFPPAT